MSSNNEEIVVENEQIVPEPIEPVVLEEKRYEYQPTDSDGRPIGAKQVIKYRTPEELTSELEKKTILLIRKLREETKRNRLGLAVEEDLGENVVRNLSQPEFVPRELTSDERVQLSRDLLDPETFDKAAETVVEAKYGISGIRKSIEQLEQDNRILKAQIEADKFLANNPDYVGVPENYQAITSWMVKNNLAPIAENFQKAYDTLKADVLVTSVEVVKPTAPVEPVIVETSEKGDETVLVREEIPVFNQLPLEPIEPIELIEVVEPKVVPAPIVSKVPTALNKSNSSSSGPVGPPADEIVYEYVQRDAQGRQVGEKKIYRGRRALDAMPSDEYKRRLLTEPGFSAKVDKAYKGK